MAGFKTHITTSTVVGIGYGTAGNVVFDLPPTSCALAAGLCGVAGMLPDLDSDSGVPVRETMALAAAIVPMLMIDRFQHFGWSQEMIVLAGATLYLLIRFGVAEIFKRYTVHRGMWHSLPAALVAGLLAFLICSCESISLRTFKATAVALGFATHLALDELWAIEFRGARWRFKRSFGTAFKLWGRNPWGNLSVYAKLLLLLALAVGDPIFMSRFGHVHETVPHLARQWWDDQEERLQEALKRPPAPDTIQR